MGKGKKDWTLPCPEMDEVTEDQEQKIAEFIEKVFKPMKASRAAYVAEREAQGQPPYPTKPVPWAPNVGPFPSSSEPSSPAAVPNDQEGPDFSTMLLPTWDRLSDEDVRLTCYKFLVARQWDMAKAEKMFRNCAKFKYERCIDFEPHFPPSFAIRGWDMEELKTVAGQTADRPQSEYDTITKHIWPHYQATYHKWDKWGHPVFIEATGNINAKGFVEKLKQLKAVNEKNARPFEKFRLHFDEVGASLVRYNDIMMQEKLGRRVMGVLQIMDCKDFNMGHLYTPALEVLRAVWEIDAAHFPEGLHGLYVVNCPGMIMFAFNIVKGWLDPRVREKVIFIKPEHTAQRLLEMIDAENLPAYLGGTCECEGGCLHGLDGSVHPPEEDPSLLSDIFTVPSGKKSTREVKGDIGEVIVWEFLVADERNVEFSAGFVPEGEDDEHAHELYLPSKQQVMDVRHVCTEKGRLVLTFSNEYSWVRDKKITLRLFTSRD